MRATVLEEISSRVVVETLDLAVSQAGEVLVEVGAAGVCRSDQHATDGHSPTMHQGLPRPPTSMAACRWTA